MVRTGTCFAASNESEARIEMKVQEIERVILEKLPGTVFNRDETGKTGALWSAAVEVSGIRDAAKAFEASGFFLEDIMALDFEDTFELVYHFNCYEPPGLVWW